jgi:hypothetical protein
MCGKIRAASYEHEKIGWLECGQDFSGKAYDYWKQSFSRKRLTMDERGYLKGRASSEAETGINSLT